MKRQQAFEKTGNIMLKCGLHCHTTVSDGEGEPAEVIRLHKKHGYDFLAITDHRVYNYKNYAEDVDITIIPGMEFDNTFERGQGFRCFHEVCIGPDDETNGFKQDERMPSGTASNQEEFQPYLDEIHAKNNLTIYCHPQWSSTPTRFFDKLKGNFAMEIWNSGSAIFGDCDNDAAYWDEILGQGKVWYGVATDDAHSYKELCKGWVMVKAEKDLNSILSALKNGEFYSSCGPEIYNFYVEDGKAVIDCSPVSKVRLHSDMHPVRYEIDDEGNLTHAEFDIENYWAGPYDYVRISITDKDGKKAWTNPIFL